MVGPGVFGDRRTLDSISVRFITAIRSQFNVMLDRTLHTILHLPHARLDVVEGQVADLRLETVEIHVSCRVKADEILDMKIDDVEREVLGLAVQGDK